MESKSITHNSFVVIEGAPQVVDLTSLKRLAAAVRFRPWPPFFKHLQTTLRPFPFHFIPITNFGSPKFALSGMVCAEASAKVLQPGKRLTRCEKSERERSEEREAV